MLTNIFFSFVHTRMTKTCMVPVNHMFLDRNLRPGKSYSCRTDDGRTDGRTKIREHVLSPDDRYFWGTVEYPVNSNPDNRYFWGTVEYPVWSVSRVVLKIHHVLCIGKTSTSPKLLYQGLHKRYRKISLFVICEEIYLGKNQFISYLARPIQILPVWYKTNHLQNGTNRNYHSYKNHYFSSQF